MTTRKMAEESKGISVITVILLIIVVGAIASAGYILFLYEKGEFYYAGETIPLENIELVVNSIKVSDRVAGYRAPIPGIEVKVGNQTAYIEPDFIFAIIWVTMNNKEDRTVSTSAVKDLMLETNFRHVYKGSSIFDVFQKFSRTDSTEEELKNLYCQDFPEEMLPKSSATSCLVFRMQESEKPVKLFYADKKGNVIFSINLI